MKRQTLTDTRYHTIVYNDTATDGRQAARAMSTMIKDQLDVDGTDHAIDTCPLDAWC